MAKNWAIASGSAQSAIAIGINNYYNLQPLNYAKRDAEAMRDWCQKEAGFDRVFLFTEGFGFVRARVPPPIIFTTSPNKAFFTIVTNLTYFPL